jgi:SanA protein
MKSAFLFILELMKGVVLASITLCLFVLLCYAIVTHAAKDSLFSADTVPSAEAALVLGASVHKDGQPSDILADRLETALELYRKGKVEKFLLSGDNGTAGYDEVNSMKDYLLERGVPGEDIFLDHAGFDSYDSVYRAKTIFGATDLIIVTQRYHLSRALYIAQALDLPVYGVPADRQTYVKMTYFIMREMLADVKAVLDVLFGSKPTSLGEPVSLDGSGEVTWD